MIEKRRVADAVKPGEKLRLAVESRQRFPRFPIRVLRQVGGQVAVAAQPVHRCEDGRVRAIDELLGGAAVAAADRGEQAVFLVPGGNHRIMLRPHRRKGRNIAHPDWTRLCDISKPRFEYPIRPMKRALAVLLLLAAACRYEPPAGTIDGSSIAEGSRMRGARIAPSG